MDCSLYVKYVPLSLSILAAILVGSSLFNEWTTNTYDVADSLRIRHVGGLTYYGIQNDMGTYTMETFIRYVGSSVYFQETADKNYNYASASLQCICGFVCIQFIYLLGTIGYTFLDIRQKAFVLKQADKMFKFSLYVYIAFFAVSFFFYIATFIGIGAAASAGFEDEAKQSKFSRGVGSGFLLHLFGSMFQTIAMASAVVLSFFFKPKDESEYASFV
ncbi:hypothetical protein EIN_053400 [Entamoeba invadens IP1]|uniref:hypothetical protein n=1 Tax=Entamoeba invadens IP1 TaxID=370355 RepID=UPI0002C3D626|nr:hypothetical protein EIN_053400 [Entamoeba invadens IP1]ELP93095.1 hypothetical protein EIN_053400 [Entamoeba invadens IP1]|eukprot:XP_004259866.1 hypothetical protein EIN_053400 [Entamoeba invadens IP1]